MNIGKIFNNLFVKNLIAAILLLVVLVFLLLAWLNSYTQHGKSVVVPDVKGMKLETAKPFFLNNSLKYEVVDSIFDRNLTPGSIIETVPPIGSKVKQGRTIFITVNSSTAMQLIVPEVVDLSQRQALAILKSIGFENLDIEIVPGAYRDLVVGIESRGREVRAGDRIEIDAKLTLLVNSGEMSPSELFFSEDSLLMETDTIMEVTPEETWF